MQNPMLNPLNYDYRSMAKILADQLNRIPADKLQGFFTRRKLINMFAAVTNPKVAATTADKIMQAIKSGVITTATSITGIMTQMESQKTIRHKVTTQANKEIALKALEKGVNVWNTGTDPVSPITPGEKGTSGSKTTGGSNTSSSSSSSKWLDPGI